MAPIKNDLAESPYSFFARNLYIWILKSIKQYFLWQFIISLLNHSFYPSWSCKISRSLFSNVKLILDQIRIRINLDPNFSPWSWSQNLILILDFDPRINGDPDPILIPKLDPDPWFWSWDQKMILGSHFYGLDPDPDPKYKNWA